MDIIHNYVDDMITVTEKEISSAIFFMLEREKILVEGVAAAELYRGKFRYSTRFLDE